MPFTRGPMSVNKISKPRKQKNRLTLYEMCLFSLLGALLFALKLAMAPLPNIEPVSLFVILFAQVYGWKGLIPLYIYVACEILFFGLGLWSVSYLYIWLVLFLTARLFHSLDSAWFWAFIAAIFGFCFGALSALVMLPVGSVTSVIAWWQAGVFFDLLHGCGNFVITLLLYHPLKKVLLYGQNRFSKPAGS